MTNMTLALPDDLHLRMKKHNDIRWSEVARQAITKKVEMLEMMEKLAGKSKMTKKDVNELAAKIDSSVAKKLGLR